MNMLRLGAAKNEKPPQAEEPPPTLTGSRPHEAQLAWGLADFVRKHLSSEGVHLLYVELGVGENAKVIVRVLEVVAHKGITVPYNLARSAEAWVATYSSHPDYESLRGLLRRAWRVGNPQSP
jgi:hypothetical protein